MAGHAGLMGKLSEESRIEKLYASILRLYHAMDAVRSDVDHSGVNLGEHRFSERMEEMLTALDRVDRKSRGGRQYELVLEMLVGLQSANEHIVRMDQNWEGLKDELRGLKKVVRRVEKELKRL